MNKKLPFVVLEKTDDPNYNRYCWDRIGMFQMVEHALHYARWVHIGYGTKIRVLEFKPNGAYQTVTEIQDYNDCANTHSGEGYEGPFSWGKKYEY